MINVLHLRDTDRVCGPGKTIIETACATDAREFSQKVGLFLLDRETTNRYRDAALARGVEVIPVRSAHPYDPRVVSTVARLVREHDIHILHSHEYKSDMIAYAVARLQPMPIMTTIHGWITHNLKRRVMIGLSQRLLPSFDRVVAVSEETRRKVKACGVPDDRLVTIHNGIVVGNYRRRDQAPGALRSRFSLPPEAVVIGNVGRLSPEKGQFDFLEAAAVLAPEFPALYFVLVGDGPDEAGLRARAQALGIADRVLFTGFLQDVRPVYRDLDVLALTSHTEGFPNVVLESLCMEVPVLATDVGGTGEVVEDDVTGVLVPAHQPAAIAAGLRRLVTDAVAARRLAETGHRAVLDRFSFEGRVRREEAVYRELMATWHDTRSGAVRAAGATA